MKLYVLVLVFYLQWSNMDVYGVLHVWFISLMYIDNKYIIRQHDSARACDERYCKSTKATVNNY